MTTIIIAMVSTKWSRSHPNDARNMTYSSRYIDLSPIRPCKILVNGVNDFVLCQLTDPRFYHLDTCFCPLDDQNALFYPQAFTAESIKAMEQKISLHPVNEADAVRFVCNAMVLGNNIVLPAGCNRTYELLSSLGYESHPVNLSEFLKGGGSAKCLTLRIDR